MHCVVPENINTYLNTIPLRKYCLVHPPPPNPQTHMCTRCIGRVSRGCMNMNTPQAEMDHLERTNPADKMSTYEKTEMNCFSSSLSFKYR